MSQRLNVSGLGSFGLGSRRKVYGIWVGIDFVVAEAQCTPTTFGLGGGAFNSASAAFNFSDKASESRLVFLAQSLFQHKPTALNWERGLRNQVCCFYIGAKRRRAMLLLRFSFGQGFGNRSTVFTLVHSLLHCLSTASTWEQCLQNLACCNHFEAKRRRRIVSKNNSSRWQ